MWLLWSNFLPSALSDITENLSTRQESRPLLQHSWSQYRTIHKGGRRVSLYADVCSKVVFQTNYKAVIRFSYCSVQLNNVWHYYAALLRRRGLHIALHSVCPSVPLSLPSVTSRHLANYSDTCTFRHALRAAYRTAISAAQILVVLAFLLSVQNLVR